MKKIVRNAVFCGKPQKYILIYSIITSLLFLNTTFELFAISEVRVLQKPSEVFEYLQQSPQLVKGVVLDEQGEPIIGAYVVLKGTTTGTTTDFDGKFSLTIPNAQSVLTFSYLGYATKELNPGSGNNFTVRLELSNETMEEVVVVGYGIQKKESVVGAITQVDNKKLVQSGTSNITNALAGKMSGVLTIQRTSQPGKSDAEIVIRGLSSWNGSKPLILVDGVERDFNSIDPNEVNLISVLKDASATAVFGAKGANGVIIVTTKRGALGKPKFDFSVSSGIQVPTNLPEHVDAYTTMNALNVGLRNNNNYGEIISDPILSEYRNPSTPLNALRYPDVDWYNLVSKGYAPSTTTNFSVSGGTEFVKYFTSIGYNYEGDFFNSYNQGHLDSRNRYNRLNYRTNLDFALTKTSQLAFNIGGDIGKYTEPYSSRGWRSVFTSSTTRYPAYFPSWVLDEVPDLNYPDDENDRLSMPIGDITTNPYSDFQQPRFNEYSSSKLFTDIAFKQDLNFITKGLSVSAKVALSTYYRKQSLVSSNTFPLYRLDWNSIGTTGNPWLREGETIEMWTQPTPSLSVGGLQSDYYSDLYYEGSVNYQRTFNNHTVSGLLLVNRQQKNAGTNFPYYNESWVGRTTYDYSHKYLIEVNVGYTGSERFAPTNRFGFFPSGAVGWVISEEQFFKSIKPIINKLKLRYSDGLVGSDLASDRWLYLSDYSKKSNHILEGKAPNVYAQWEQARKQDLGVEMGLFKNLITLGVDIFKEDRDNMLLVPKNTTAFIGNEFKQLNLGKLKKHGMELELEFNKTNSAGLNYYMKGIFGFSENRILFKDDFLNAPEYQKEAGKSVGSQTNGVSTTGSGYFTSVDDIQNYPLPISLGQIVVGDYKYLDYSADGLINSNDKHAIAGSKYAPITFSLSGGLNYKNFEFNLLLQGNQGKYVDYGFYDLEFFATSWRINEPQLNYWTPTNTAPDRATLHYGPSGAANLAWGGGGVDGGGYSNKLQGHSWINADYIRVKEVFISYKMKPAFLNKLFGVSSFILYASGNNLFTFSNMPEGDPERTEFHVGFYPMLATYKVGLKVGF